MPDIDPSTSLWTSSEVADQSHISILTDSPYRHPTPESKPSEQLRARELLRYYTPSSPQKAAVVSPLSTPGLEDGLQLGSAITDVHVPYVASENRPVGRGGAVMKSSEDPALTAFAQLLTLKLNCERSMVSFIDRTKQYIVAEATRTLSITEPMQPSMQLAPDGLWLGCDTISPANGLCVNTIQLYPDIDPERDSENNLDVSSEAFTILEIPDLTLDPRFRARDYVVNSPHLRFYAGTPLRTRRGYNIGSLCVVDSSPRTLTEDERKSLGRMGKLVMQHLEMSAERKALRRNQRMAECLGRFVAGKYFEPAVGAAEQRHSMPPPDQLKTLKDTFSRASELIRDALKGDGVVFVDADKVYDTSSFSSSRRKGPHLGKRKKTGILGWSCEIEWDEVGVENREDEAWKREEMQMPGVLRDRGIVPSDGIIQQMLELYPSGTILCFDEPIKRPRSSSNSHQSQSSSSCSDSAPNSPPRPSVSPSDSEDQPGADELVFNAVQDFLPHATSVLFVPLCHFGGKPYAASFSWVRDTRRVFSNDELMYMRGFMNSIMAEVSRLSTISADKAKGEFISSISHELRSPLHGVLASAEFLADTSLNAFQRNFVETVESCGRMLLDTINHVLDFRKLDSLMQSSRNASGELVNLDADAGVGVDAQLLAAGMRTPSYGAVVSPIEAMDVSAIAEQVVESVYSGYEYKGMSSAAASSQDETRPSGGTGLFSNSSGLSDGSERLHLDGENVTVILDIDKREDWTFISQPGAIRRILMNIFANALKYTDKGWVRVHLEAHDLPSESDGTEKSKVTITVSDSGRGISREFLKTKLFIPFSQEDALVSGTGLGMSIVRQIVELLGGDVEVKSHVNVGTEVSVILVLKRPPRVDADASAELSLVQQTRRLTEGKTMSLRGFDDLKSLELSPLHDGLAALRGSIVRYARDWFGMTVSQGPLDQTHSDMILANETPDILQYLEKHTPLPNALHTPVLVLCSNVSRHRTSYAASGDLFDFASKPCGPLKLAKALRMCLEHVDRTHTPVPQVVPHPTMTIAPPSKLTNGAHPQAPEVRSTMDEHAPLPITPPIPQPNDQLKPHVLIVEDNPINLMLLATFLKKKKYPYTKAENGLIGVQAVQARPGNFDVILMDLQMPVMSGIEAIRIIRQLERDNPIKMKRARIIALTGLAGNENMDEAYEAGVDLFLTKPVTFKTVDEELDQWKAQATMASADYFPLAKPNGSACV